MSDEATPGGFINLEKTFCPRCGERMPALRVPDGLQQLMWGGWTCPNCGCRMDRWGRPVDEDDKGTDASA